MNTAIELVPYEPIYAPQTAQAFLQVFTTAPWNETLTLNDILSQLEVDYSRPGFGGVLIKSGQNVAGFSWWFELTGRELNDKWRPRFTPREKVPTPDGCGVFLNEFGIVPSMRHHGLGKRLIQTTLGQIEPMYDWIALNTHRFAHAGLALLKSYAFEDLGLTGMQVQSRMCLMKTIRPK